MRKKYHIITAIFCIMAATGCGRAAAGNSAPPDMTEAPSPSPEASVSSAETPPPAAENNIPVNSDLPTAALTPPNTVADYLNMAEALWRSSREHVDYRTAYGNEALDQTQAIDLAKDYDCEVVLSEDFAETGNFTLSLSVDGTRDGIYVLEGNNDYVSIVFGEAYLLENSLYMGTNVSDTPPFCLNLETKALTDCKKEYETLDRLFKDYLQGQPESTNLSIQCLHPMAQVDGCLIYLATISETSDTDIRGIIYAAFDKSRSLRAYLLLAPEYILSDVTIEEQTDVTMEMQQLSPSGCLLTIRNTGEKTIEYGTQYTLERDMGGTWYSFNQRENTEFPWPDVLYRLESGEETTLELQWDSLYGFLPEGRYRLVKNISCPDSTDGREDFSAAIYFNVTLTGVSMPET